MSLGMEDWQREFINENLPELITSIKCDVLLLASLVEYGAISPEEADNLESMQGKKINKASALIRILQERVGAYGHLAKALQKCTHTGAFSILLKGIQEHLILKDVFFGGARLPLQNLCKPNYPASLQNIIASEVNEDTYEQFLNPLPWTLSTDTIPETLPYYIARTLSINNEIDPKIFQELDSDIFCIEGVELIQLSNLIRRKRKHDSTEGSDPPDHSRNQIDGVTTRFIHLERQDHFLDIAQHSSKPVHWFQFSEGKYWHVKSSPESEVKNVSRFLVPNSVKTVSEEEFVEECLRFHGPVFIYDLPGMGKSVLLANLARKMKESRPEDNVVHFEFADLIQKVRQVNESCRIVAIKQVLVKHIAKNELGRKILEKLLDLKGHQIKLFLDGYDQVPQSDSLEAQKMLEDLVKEGENLGIFVATRPHKKNELEEIFGVLGYYILPFDNSNKLAFFLKYWQTKHGVEITDKIKEFAEHCLKIGSSKISNDDNDTATPLQCQMLAETYSKDATKGGLIPF